MIECISISYILELAYTRYGKRIFEQVVYLYFCLYYERLARKRSGSEGKDLSNGKLKQIEAKQLCPFQFQFN